MGRTARDASVSLVTCHDHSLEPVLSLHVHWPPKDPMRRSLFGKTGPSHSHALPLRPREESVWALLTSVLSHILPLAVALPHPFPPSHPSSGLVF